MTDTAHGPVAFVGEVVGDPAALTGCVGDWESLVEAASQPYCSAPWLLGWWKHAAPVGARLAVVVVRESEGSPGAIAGIAPGFFDRGRTGLRRWRPLGAQTCQRVQPLALPGQEAQVADAITRALLSHPDRPDVLTFEGVPEDSPWPALLAQSGPGPAMRIVRTGASTAPGMHLSAPSFEDWLAGKSAHFRQRLRKDRRTAVKQGCMLRRAGVDDAAQVVEAFLAQHAARWAAEGGSSAVTPRVAATLRAVGPELVRSGRLQLWALDVDGETIATRLLFSAGHEVGAWLSSYDPARFKLRPSMVTMLGAVEAVFGQGASHLDLGEGVFDYKARFADHEQTLLRLVLVPRAAGPVRAARITAGLAPLLARRALADHLPQERKTQLRGLLGRAS